MKGLSTSCRKHPYHINGRFVYLVLTQVILALSFWLRDVLKDRFTIRWSRNADTVRQTPPVYIVFKQRLDSILGFVGALCAYNYSTPYPIHHIDGPPHNSIHGVRYASVWRFTHVCLSGNIPRPSPPRPVTVSSKSHLPIDNLLVNVLLRSFLLTNLKTIHSTLPASKIHHHIPLDALRPHRPCLLPERHNGAQLGYSVNAV